MLPPVVLRDGVRTPDHCTRFRLSLVFFPIWKQCGRSCRAREELRRGRTVNKWTTRPGLAPASTPRIDGSRVAGPRGVGAGHPAIRARTAALTQVMRALL